MVKKKENPIMVAKRVARYVETTGVVLGVKVGDYIHIKRTS